MSGHDFEERGLGKAPFELVDYIDNYDTIGKCARCGHALRYECIVLSSDGRKFSVGRDCVQLAKEWSIDTAIGVRIQELENAELVKLKAELEQRLRDSAFMARLRARPHPHWHHKEKNYYDYFTFVAQNGGPRKQIEAIRTCLEIGAGTPPSGLPPSM